LPDSAIDQLERLASAERLSALGAASEPPARLHGDLWAGNRLVGTSGQSWLIDPAAHGGHREFDLAMMRLFGGFGPECFAAYDEVHPLESGWEDRVALHQIAPLVVNSIMFGGSTSPRRRPPSPATADPPI
jgi:fructosamine-3-kinase